MKKSNKSNSRYIQSAAHDRKPRGKFPHEFVVDELQTLWLINMSFVISMKLAGLLNENCAIVRMDTGSDPKWEMFYRKSVPLLPEHERELYSRIWCSLRVIRHVVWFSCWIKLLWNSFWNFQRTTYSWINFSPEAKSFQPLSFSILLHPQVCHQPEVKFINHCSR